MSIDFLDSIFPYVLFAYGFMIVSVLNGPWTKIRAHEYFALLQAKEPLALLCLCGGSVWILQRLWLS